MTGTNLAGIEVAGEKTSGFVFVIRGVGGGHTVFVSPNRHAMPPTAPPGGPDVETDHIKMTEAMRTRWFDPRYPQIPYITSSPDLIAPFLTCLRMEGTTFPIENSDQGWRLRSELVSRWIDLEYKLKTTITFLVSRASNLPLEWKRFPSPSFFAFSQYTDSLQEAERRVKWARLAFDILMAEVTYSTTLQAQTGVQASERTSAPVSPPWVIALESVDGLGPVWAETIWRTHLSAQRPNIGRKGVFLCSKSSQFTPEKALWIRYDIPFWIRYPYGTQNPSTNDIIFRKYRPLTLQQANHYSLQNTTYVAHSAPVRAGRDPASHRIQERSQTRLPTAAQDIPVAPSIPSASASSAVIPAEKDAVDAFFEAQLERHRKYLLQETSQQREAREARERANANYPVPGRNGAQVFEWEKENGKWKRVPVSRGAVESCWSTWHSSTLRYNSIDNVWDVCEKWQSHTYGTFGLDLEEDDAMDGWVPSTEGNRPAPEKAAHPIPPTQEETAAAVAVATAQIATVEDQLTQVYRNRLRMKLTYALEAAMIRCGFVWPGNSIGNFQDPIEYGRVMDILGGVTDVDHNMDGTQETRTLRRQQFSHFVSVLIRMSVNSQPTNIPRNITSRWDISDECPAGLHQHALRSPVTRQQIQVRSLRLMDNSTIWGLATHQDCSTMVLSADPLTVMAWLRLALKSPGQWRSREFASECMQRGMSFLVLGRIDKDTYTSDQIRNLEKTPREEIVSAGERPAGHTFTKFDFAAYQESLKEQLRTTAIGVAAMQEGGLLWRLVVGFMDVDQVLEEPVASREVVARNDRGFLFKKVLHEDQAHFICGTYRMRTGKKAILNTS